MKLNMHKLTYEMTSKTWNNAFTRHVDSLKLKHYILHDIKDPTQQMKFNTYLQHQLQILSAPGCVEALLQASNVTNKQMSQQLT